MKFQNKTKTQLIEELEALYAELKKSDKKRRRDHNRFRKELDQLSTALDQARKVLQKESAARKELTRKFRASDKLLESIFGNLNFLVAYMDVNFNFIRVNRAYAVAAGKTEKFFFGKNHFDLFPSKENQAVFEMVVETGVRYVAHEEPFKYPGSKESPITYWDWILDPVKNSRKKVTGLILSLIDVTEQHQAKELLIQKSKNLEWSNKELSEFAFSASHDLQEPLRKIQSFIDLLIPRLTGKIDHEEMDFLARMQNASKRMKTMLDALLKYSRVATRADQFQLVNLTDCVKEALSNLQPRIEQADARIELDDLPSIEGDFDQFIQLFQNLIGNSLKFHHKNRPPEVKITGYIVTPDPEKQLKADQSDRMLSDDYCKIMIEDNGIGFDEKFLERIFLPFQRLHGRFDYEGTGMGLAICRKIIARHGGRIIAMSRPESGATFIVAIPLKQEKQIKTTTEKLSVV